MRIQIASDPDRAVTEDVADDLQRHGCFKRQGGEGVSQIMKPGLRQVGASNPPIECATECLRSNPCSKSRTEDEVGRGRGVKVVGAQTQALLVLDLPVRSERRYHGFR